MSADNPALPLSKSESVARRTFRICAAVQTVSPDASIISVRISSPGCGGFFISLVYLQGESIKSIDAAVLVAESIENYLTAWRKFVSRENVGPKLIRAA